MTDLVSAFEGLLEGAGISLVECVASDKKSGIAIKAVVYSPDGTGLEECAKAHRIIASRADTLYPDRDVSVEVSSPGIDRQLRRPRDYAIFRGRGVKLLLVDSGNEWTGGVIDSADDHGLVLAVEGSLREAVAWDRILKAALDASREGETHHVV